MGSVRWFVKHHCAENRLHHVYAHSHQDYTLLTAYECFRQTMYGQNMFPDLSMGWPAKRFEYTVYAELDAYGLR